jgi:hypothetical protein
MRAITPMLTDPSAHGADPGDAFHVVVPSGQGRRRMLLDWRQSSALLRVKLVIPDVGALVSTTTAEGVTRVEFYPAPSLSFRGNALIATSARSSSTNWTTQHAAPRCALATVVHKPRRAVISTLSARGAP